MEVRVYGGLWEIGGNKVLLRGEGSIFLDFGMSFSGEEAYFQHPFMKPSSPEDYEKVGLLPPLKELEIDAIFISHAHLDHYGYADLLNSPVYMGEAAFSIVSLSSQLRRDKWRSETRTFRTGDLMEVMGFKVLPVHVDHSVPGSYGFIVECCGRTVGYTGDMRMHGPRSDMTKDFLDRLSSEEVDLLIMEATKLSPENDPESSLVKLLENRVWYKMRKPPKRVNFEVSDESQVLERLKGIGERAGGLMVVETSQTDVDRIRTVFEVARGLDRTLVIDERVALYAEELGNMVEGLPGVGDYLLWKRRRLEGGKEVRLGSREAAKVKELVEKVEDRLGEEGVIWGEKREELVKRQGEVLILTNNATRLLYELPRERVNLTFVMSRSEPYNEESALGLDRLINWLILFKVPKYYRVHVSGHMPPEDYQKVLEAVNPRKVLPIHSEHPDLFEDFIPSKYLDRVILPDRESFTLSL